MSYYAIIIGRKGSRLKNKNTRKVLGRALCEYPILAAKNSNYIKEVFISTDCPEIMKISKLHNLHLIERPSSLATNEALAEDVFKYCYDKISELVNNISGIVLLFANGATITPGIIDSGINLLEENPSLDSAVSVSQFNMFSPLRARKIENNRVLPFINPEYFPNASCDRDSQGDTFYADCSVFIVRPRCFDYKNGQIPFRWIGKNVVPLYQEVGFDVDYEWQFPVVEYFLKKNGFSETETPYKINL